MFVDTVDCVHVHEHEGVFQMKCVGVKTNKNSLSTNCFDDELSLF